MARQHRKDIIEVLDCDLGARPASAPGVDRLVPYARGVTRTTNAVVVEFEDQVAEALEAFVEAERLCCAGIDWQIERLPALRLWISASEEQLRAIESLWSSNRT